MEEIICVKDLKKTYNGKNVVDGISFSVKKGEFFTLLGVNGAGKTTTMNMICTSILPDGGTIWVDGRKVGKKDGEIKKRIGVVFQNGVLDDLLTVEENLYTRGRLYGLKGVLLQKRIGEVAEQTGIEGFLQKPYGLLSGGQKRRCDIARALLHQPQILFLDEPGAGLDLKMRRTLWEVIHSIRRSRKMTVFLTTHDMEEAETADHMVVLKNGRIYMEGTPEQFTQRFAKDHLRILTEKTEPLKRIFIQRKIPFSEQDNALQIPLKNTLDALRILELCKGGFSGFEVTKGSMEEAYLGLPE